MIGMGMALWFGILTSISPCPLATNIAAVSYIGRRVERTGYVLSAGLLYMFGRMITYVLLGALLVSSAQSIPSVANFLQKYMHKILGPLLFVVGLFLLDIIRFNISGVTLSKEKQESLAASGLKGSFTLGVIFALAFCPISAALFFGSLIPLSLNKTYGIILPFLYAIGTGLPVLAFSFGIAFGIATLSRWFNKMATLEKYTRKITGIIFLLVGSYFIWIQIQAIILRG